MKKPSKRTKKPWRNEGELRQWLSETIGKQLFWVEPAFGSTVGMPDACIVVDATYLWAELKLAWRPKGGRGALRWTVRPAQKRTLRRLLAQGADVVWIMAVEGTRRVVVMPVNEATLRGEWKEGPYTLEFEA